MANKNLKLVDVTKPNLYRETFPYSEFPRVIFDNIKVSYDIPDNIWITDTTFRDGQQARPPYKPEQILKIYDDPKVDFSNEFTAENTPLAIAERASHNILSNIMEKPVSRF